MYKKIILSLLLLVPNISYSNTIPFMTGQKLYTMMISDSLNQLEAINYVMGVSDTILPILCLKGSVSTKQIYDWTKQMLEQYPNYRTKNASDVIMIVLNREFSCQANPKKDHHFENRQQRPKTQVLI